MAHIARQSPSKERKSQKSIDQQQILSLSAAGYESTPRRVRIIHGTHLLPGHIPPSPEISPDFSSSNYTFATSMDLAQNSKSLRKSKSRKPEPHDAEQQQQTPMAPHTEKDSLLFGEIPSDKNRKRSTSKGQKCLIPRCPKKNVSYSTSQEFLDHVRECHYKYFKCHDNSGCMFFKFTHTRIICSSCQEKHPEMKAAKKIALSLQPLLRPNFHQETPETVDRVAPKTPVREEKDLPPTPPVSDMLLSLSLRCARSNSQTAAMTSRASEKSPVVMEDMKRFSNSSSDASTGEMFEEDSENVDCDDPTCRECRHLDDEGTVESLFNSLLNEVRDAALGEVFSIVDPEWAEELRSRGGASNRSSTRSSASFSATQRSKASLRGKRTMQDRDSLPPDEQGGDESKRPRIVSTISHDGSDLPFACPYDKRDLQKHGSRRRYRRCAKFHFRCNSRLKEHLYRNHCVSQCPRCGSEFRTRSDLDSHLVEVPICEMRPFLVTEGVTEEKKDQLKSRAGLSNMSRVEQWNQIYQILFPGEPIPSAYYEELPPAQCESVVSQSSSSARLSVQSQHGALQPSQQPRPPTEPTPEPPPSASSQIYNPSRGSAEFAAFTTYSRDNLLAHVQRIIDLRIRAFQRDVPDIIRDAYASMLSEFRCSHHYSSGFSQTFTPRTSLNQVDEHVGLRSPQTEILPYYNAPPQWTDMMSEMCASSLRAVRENMPEASDSGYGSLDSALQGSELYSSATNPTDRGDATNDTSSTTIFPNNQLNDLTFSDYLTPPSQNGFSPW